MSPKPDLDQARLRPHLRNTWTPGPTYTHHTTAGTQSTHTNTITTHSWQHPNPADLRGIPVVGRGVPGTQPGTQPHQAITKLEKPPYKPHE